MNVAVCDYGAGNVRSVAAALRRLGAHATVTSDPATVLDAQLAVLPGVGSAASAMHGLSASGLDDALRERVNEDRPTLGICLGLQLALEESEEDGGVRGLALVPGRAVQLRAGRVPRIGWARVERPSSPAVSRESAMEERDPRAADTSPLAAMDGEAFYFAHSYAAVTPNAVACSEDVVAAAENGSFLGVQFHPEKSGAAGARFLAACLSRA